MRNNTMVRNSLSSWRERGEQTPKLGRSAASLRARGLLTAHGAGFATCMLPVGSTPFSGCPDKGGRDVDGEVLLCMDQMTTSICWCSSFRCKVEPRGAHPSNKEILCNNSIRQGSTRHLESHARNAGKRVIAIKIVDKNLPLDCRGFVPTLSCLVLLHPQWGCLALAAALPPRKNVPTSHRKHTPMGHRAGSWAKRCSFATDRNRSGVASPCAEVCAPMFLVVSEANHSCVLEPTGDGCWWGLPSLLGSAHTSQLFSISTRNSSPPHWVKQWRRCSITWSLWVKKGHQPQPTGGGTQGGSCGRAGAVPLHLSEAHIRISKTHCWISFFFS